MSVEPLSAEQSFSAPAPNGLWRELRLLREPARLGLSLPWLMGSPRGDGSPVLLFPGYGTGDRSLAPLRAFLRWLGYDARGWELGKNGGNVPNLVPQVTRVTESLFETAERPVGLVGWSLGGVLAREVARDRPDLVSRVITIGSPIVGGPSYTVLADRYRRRGFDLDAIARAVAERNRVPIERPITAIYSRKDPIVAWQACVDRISPRVENREVKSSHLGLILDPKVFRIVATALAR